VDDKTQISPFSSESVEDADGNGVDPLDSVIVELGIVSDENSEERER
jgi:hypothetical protein